MFIKATAWTYDREYDGSTGLTIKTEVKLLFASFVLDSDNVLCEYAKIMQGETQITCFLGCVLDNNFLVDEFVFTFSC